MVAMTLSCRNNAGFSRQKRLITKWLRGLYFEMTEGKRRKTKF